VPAPQSFDDAWPALSDRLRASLVVRGVPAQDRDDVVQETALRVYRVWETLDPERPAWPFVVTVGVNIWRDILRERLGRNVDIRPTASMEMTGDHDVERLVLARQELATVGAAMRELAPEQRKLLFATEEFGDVVRPLLPAERVARMRVRRQLARAVGRASAVIAVVWLRRPARSAGLVATAYAGAMAAAVLTSPVPLELPAPAAGGAGVGHHITRTAPAAHAQHAESFVSRPVASDPRAHAVTAVISNPSKSHPGTTHGHRDRTRVCSPTAPPGGAVSGHDIRVGSAGVYEDDGTGEPQPIVTTPPVVAESDTGCVAVG
jgi:hypothetical protein